MCEILKVQISLEIESWQIQQDLTCIHAGIKGFKSLGAEHGITVAYL